MKPVALAAVEFAMDSGSSGASGNAQGKSAILERILQERPAFHRGETEVLRSFDPEESLLSRKTATDLSSDQFTCYGIGTDVMRFLADHLGEGSRSLETGAGCSTLVFALTGSTHVAVTPAESEALLIKDYAQKIGVAMDKVTFSLEVSETYLPRCEASDLDLVLIDGKHAFPWPIIDWFYTADRLKKGGVMLVDDVQMKPVWMLAEFLNADAGWKRISNLSGKTFAYEKLCDSALDVAWHMQAYSVNGPLGGLGLPSVLRKLANRLK